MNSMVDLVALGNLVTIVMGQAPSSNDCNFEGRGTPFVKAGEFAASRPVVREWTTNPLKLARRTDVLLCVVGATCGKLNLGEDCAIGRSVAAIRPDPAKLDQFYLHYFLMTLVDQLRAGSVGAAQTVISKEMIQSIPFPWRDFSEQRRIVAILDDVFEGIATTKANAEKNLHNARHLFESQLGRVFTECGPDWSRETIDQHIRFIDYRGRTPEKTAHGLRLITAKNVKKGFIQEEPMEFVDSESYDGWMTRGIPRVGDVLFTTEAPLGNVAQLDTEDRVVFAQRVIIMQANPNVLDSTLLKYMLLSAPVQARIHAQATGATAQGIKASLLKRIEISFPRSLPDQQALVAMLDSLAEDSGRLERIYAGKLAALDELKQSLLHQAFSGAL